MGKKIKILFATVHRKSRSPSQRFRFEQYISFLEKNGFQCYHSFLLNEKDDKIFYSSSHVKKIFLLIKILFNRIKELRNSYDITFVQREAFILGSIFFERKYKKKSKLVFDFDDAIWMHQKGEIKSANKLFYWLKNPQKTKELISISDVVIAGNQYLADFAKQFNKKVVVIPTTIDTDEYIPKPVQKTQEGICIGWSGSFSTIIHFEYITPALELIRKKYGDKVYFKVIGDGTYKNKELEIIGLPWAKDTELDDLNEIEIGIMPLPDDEWAKGKCGLKGLQYMALQIPTIMSPVGVNSAIIQHKENGLLASSIEEWVNALSYLIENAPERLRIGIEGRKTVVEKYSIYANKHKYLNILNQVVKVYS